jgi:hypothetical protein
MNDVHHHASFNIFISLNFYIRLSYLKRRLFSISSFIVNFGISHGGYSNQKEKQNQAWLSAVA